MARKAARRLHRRRLLHRRRPGPKPTPVEDRFAKFVEVDPESGCHRWTGYIDPEGYARISYRGRSRYAHQISWRMANGWKEIPAGKEILHGCIGHRSCVAPSHLRLGD